MPQPPVLRRNGTFVAWRKLHTRVAAFRKYLHDNASGPDEESLLAAKIVGRWPSGAPLILAPEHNDPVLGVDDQRNNHYLYQAADPQGLICPHGAHARRANPRDSDIIGDVHLHRMIRRGTSYGPPLPTGVIEDDGADRGIVFVSSAHTSTASSSSSSRNGSTTATSSGSIRRRIYWWGTTTARATSPFRRGRSAVACTASSVLSSLVGASTASCRV